MPFSIARKVRLSLILIVSAAIGAMLLTYLVSTAATRAMRESQQRTQIMLENVAHMEADIVSGGLRVFQYLESGDPYYRDAYSEHRNEVRRHITELAAHTDFTEGQEAARLIAYQHTELDQANQEILTNFERIHQALSSAFATMPRLAASSASLSEGHPPGSAQYVTGKQVEAARSALFIAVLDFIHRDRGDGTVGRRIEELRALIAQFRKLPLSLGHQKLAGDFEQAFEQFSAIMARVLEISQVNRDHMSKMLLLQRQITATINARITPELQRYTATVERNAGRRVRSVLYIAGGISLLLSLLALLVGRYLRRTIVSPIRALAAGADRVAAGNLDHRVRITTDDEYSELASNFNRMVEQLQGSMVSRAAHEEQASQLRALLDGVHDYAIFSMDERGFVTRWNTASTRILGHAAEDMEGVSFARIFRDTEQARAARDEALNTIAAGGRFETNTIIVRKNGEGFDANVVVTPLTATDGTRHGYTVVVRDITEKVKTERHIEQLATTDALTGLSNRNMLMEQLGAAIARAARSRTQLALMFIDLDNFKTVNDTLGHAAGDELLRECAQRLTDCVRKGDVVARLGGDEFVVLLTQVADSAVSPVADRMLQLLCAPYRVHGQEAQISASIGICFYPTDGADVTSLMKNADIAMYHAKAQNRNNYQFYAEEMNRRMLERAQLERELRAALENSEFVMHYQPLVSIATGEITGVESLIRWQHPTRGLLSPFHFIAVAEQSGLIVRMGDWILNHVCATIKGWQDKGVRIGHIGVNVSAAQLSEGLVGTIRNVLATHDITAGALVLEITETMLMERVDDAIGILRRIRELGVRIAMDDFGTGYSSLSLLQRLPLDTLKIDRSFVNAIDDEDNSRAVAIIGAMIAIAKELNLSVVAEGVETPTQLAFLRTLNCDTYQGYLFSKPVDTISLEARVGAAARTALVDEHGRAVTSTTKVTLELNAGQE